MILQGDSATMLRTLPDKSVNCCVTSPPYFALRDYGVAGQIGLEPTIEAYLERLLAVFDEVKRVLRDDGVCFVNLGDSYSGTGRGQTDAGKLQYASGSILPCQADWNGIPSKSLCLIPYRFAQAMIERSWVLRNIVVWHKPNAMPHSVKDRFTVDFEPVFFFVKSQKYWFKQQFEDAEEKEKRFAENPKYSWHPNNGLASTYGTNSNGRNKRTVWSIPTQAFSESHFAVFPEELASTLIDCGCPPGGVVLDPFMGAGTVALCAERMGMKWVGVELNPEYCRMIEDRVRMEAAQCKLPLDFEENAA